jgi:iron only hydrogenase large subunit-like protein
MVRYFHSVRLDSEKCKGCTNCIKRCPVEAIRVHDGKATIMEERCIDCGECIRSCPNHAKIAITDTLEKLSEYKYRIALPAPSFFGQFKNQEHIEDILHAFLKLGFDEVFEVALAAEIIGFIVHKQLMADKVKKPLFSSACPAVLRLIQIRFPELLKHCAPILTPMEVAARLAKEAAAKKTGLTSDEIGAFFISPCPAKVTEMKHPMSTKYSAVNGVIGANLIYKEMIREIARLNGKDKQTNLQKATNLGIAWGFVTGESKNIDFGRALAVSGIHNVISLHDEIDRGELQDVDFFELQACTGGCVGGPLNVTNLFVGRVRLRDLIKRFGSKTPYFDERRLYELCGQGQFEATEPFEPRFLMPLDEDVAQALIKMERIDQITDDLPGLDCGACGSPSCRALAEDVVRGIALESDCIIKLREKVKTLAGEMLDLARIAPPGSPDNTQNE